MPRNSSRVRPGFVTYEILHIVVILALLISILLPSLSRARALAKVKILGDELKTYTELRQDLLPYESQLSEKGASPEHLAVLRGGDARQSETLRNCSAVMESIKRNGEEKPVEFKQVNTEMQILVGALRTLQAQQFPFLTRIDGEHGAARWKSFGLGCAVGILGWLVLHSILRRVFLAKQPRIRQSWGAQPA